MRFQGSGLTLEAWGLGVRVLHPKQCFFGEDGGVTGPVLPQPLPQTRSHAPHQMGVQGLELRGLEIQDLELQGLDQVFRDWVGV